MPGSVSHVSGIKIPLQKSGLTGPAACQQQGGFRADIKKPRILPLREEYGVSFYINMIDVNVQYDGDECENGGYKGKES